MPLIRLQKILADAGIASRRAGERMIVEGRVTVDGRRVTELGTKVDPDKQEVSVDGQPLRARRKLYIALNKPRDFLCTRSDPEGRRVVGELLPEEWRNLYTVGRLDRQSEGLIFLTNDGDFSLRLTHPRYGVSKVYLARVIGFLEQRDVRRFLDGIEEGGEVLKAERVRLISANHSHSVVELELAQGKNREVRRLFEALGHQVERLQRIRIGPVPLGRLPVGRWRVLTSIELKSLLRATE